jgi:hypothetical protein
LSRARLLSCAVALLVGAAHADPSTAPADTADGAAAESAPAELDPGVPREEISAVARQGPLAVFAAVEIAWAEEDVDALVALLDPEDRVRVAMATAGPRGGWFNRDQAFFLLKDMFAFTNTERFQFERYWNLDSRGRSPYAVAVRGLGTPEGTSREDRVYISLRRRGDDWYVGEIRSIDR